jgi:hypothetical protein
LEIEAHLLFDTPLDVPLEIHKKSVGGLGLHPETATGQRVDVEFAGGVKWMGITIRAERVPLLEDLTKRYSKELEEVPVVGLVGPLAINSNVIELDLRRQLLRTMGMASDEARAAEIPYEAKPHGIVISGVGAANKPVKAVLVTKSEDLVLDTSLLKSARGAGKRPNELQIGDVAFGDLSAIRFQDVGIDWPAPVNAVIGAEALKNCTVTLWPKRKMIAFLAQPAPSFPEAEQEYFFALAEQKASPRLVALLPGDSDKRLELDDPIRLMSLERLDEMNRDPDFRKIFDMVIAEQYMAGRLADSEFHASSRYRFVKDRYPGHVKLVEFFVNSSDEITGGM